MKHFVLAIFTIFYTVSFGQTTKLASEVEIRRTNYGVPHIKANSLKAVAFGLAFAEMEDYGDKVIIPLIAARGDLAMLNGYESIDSDFIRQQSYEIAKNNYSQHDPETIELLEGFAEGVNFYISKHGKELDKYKDFHFTGLDVAAASTSITTVSAARRFLRNEERKKAVADSLARLQEEGSNAWAFGPTKTKSGNAVLVRNPHLRWSAGYYEAQITVPGVLNFYGDFRIGGLFAIIGGFNENLGWSTTNNGPDLNEIYSFSIDPEKPDHYLLDGKSLSLERKMITANFKNGEGSSLETREFLYTPYGPVVHRENGKIVVIKTGGDGETRRCDQFTRMLLSKNFAEWKNAMKMQAITQSNYTYADRDGNIYYVWNATTPKLPLPSGKDTSAVEVTKSEEIWSSLHPYDELPQLLNPKGGYLHNENDPFHFTNLNEVFDPEKYPDNFPNPRLRQRSQLSLKLISDDKKLTLEEIVKKKHDMTMYVAVQIKQDLLKILKNSAPDEDMKKAIQHLEKWDNTVSKESRGGILFGNWFLNYEDMMEPDDPFAISWSFDKPMETPQGIADADKAVEAFQKTMEGLKEKYGTWDLAWGDIHRVRRGDLDLPVGGCTGALGCFRVLWFNESEDGKRVATGGDGWQFAVEFGKKIKAYSVLAYGQTPDTESPHHTDQLKMFSDNEMKPVLFYEKEIKKGLIRSYTPLGGN